MRWPRNFVLRATAICVTLALMGCGSDSTSPHSARPNPPTPSAPVPSSIVAVSTLSQVGWAGLNARAPVVQVLDQNRRPMANVSVSFAVTRGGGSVLTASMKTTQDGGFAATTWILGKQGGPNTVVASVGGLDGVSFEADATVPVIVARYDLDEVDGAPLPFHYPADPTLITGGHILITADNEFAFGLDINGVSNLAPTGNVVRVDATTVYFVSYGGLDPDAPNGISGLFATGLVEGNTMLFSIDESIGFRVLKYVLKN